MRRAIGWVGAALAAIVVLPVPAVSARPVRRVVRFAHRKEPARAASAFLGSDIGTVDVQRLQSEYQKATDLQNELAADQEKFQADLAAGQDDIKSLQAEIASDDAAVQAATSDVKVRAQLEAARHAARDRLSKVRNDFAARLQQRKEQSDEIAAQLNADLLKNAKQAVATVARRHHIQAVIDSRIGLLGLPDLTDEVLAVLNSSPDSSAKPRSRPTAK